ncbi:DUF4494 domain-containing protein [Runella zeae]|uniref:DUF4494 domain-containing protein n=1 Tax=Runella zeae TaxID=94255 RepID=UPI00235356F7|nr:DUF4494 domain-containing protein [Runella zeae]
MWNIVKIKYQQEQENGSLKTLTESYLVEAVSFSDAEARIYKLMADGAQEFTVAGISKASFSDIFYDEGAEKFWIARVLYISINEVSGKEKKVYVNMYVQGENILSALRLIEEELKDSLVPYEIVSLKLTSILEVYPLQEDETA